MRDQSTSYNPTMGDELEQKRLVRCLESTVAVAILFGYQEKSEKVVVAVYANWARQSPTCKSVSCRSVRCGRHLLEYWVVSQATAALSSGESEFHAIGSGSARAA